MAEAVLAIKVDDKQAVASFRNLERAQTSFVSKSKKGNKQLQDENKKTAKTVSVLDKGYQELETRMTLFQGFVGGVFVGTMVALTKSATETALSFERIDKRLTFALGSSREAEKTFQRITDLSNRLAINTVEAAKGFAGLAASTKGTSLEGEKTFQIFKALTQAGASLALSNQDLELTFLAVQQIASKGVVSMEELRRQLGERLPGTLNIAARALGITTGELNDLVSSGQLAAEDFLPKFAEELSKTFSGTAGNNVNTLSGQIALLKNEFTDLAKVTLDNGLLDALKFGIGAARATLEAAGAPFRTIGGVGVNSKITEQMERQIKILEIAQKTRRGITEEQEKELETLIRVRDRIQENNETRFATEEELRRQQEARGESFEHQLDMMDLSNRAQEESIKLTKLDNKNLEKILKNDRSDLQVLEDKLDIVNKLLEKESLLTEEKVRGLEVSKKALEEQIALQREPFFRQTTEGLVGFQQQTTFAPEGFQALLEGEKKRLEESVEANKKAEKEKERAAKKAAKEMAKAYEERMREMEEVNRTFAQSFEDSIIESFETGKLSFKSFLDDIKRMAIRAAIRQNISGPLFGLTGRSGVQSGGGGNPLGVIGGLLGIGRNHTGSGDNSRSRVSASVFNGAPRFHNGGVVGNGLFGREVPAILQRGEGVFTPQQMKSMGGKTTVNVINNTNQEATATTVEGPDGEEMIEIVIGRVEENIAQGNFNNALKLAGV